MRSSPCLAGLLVTLAVAFGAAAQPPEATGKQPEATAEPADASPQPPPKEAITLDWEAPAECPSTEQVLADAKSLAASAKQDERVERLAVRGVVRRLESGSWRLVIRIGTAKRQLEADSCEELSRAGALFIALLMNPSMRQALEGPPEITRAPSKPAPEQEPRPEPAPPTHPPAEPTPAPPPEAEADSWFVAAGALLDSGTLPELAVLGQLGLGRTIGSWQLELMAAAGPRQRQLVGGAVGADLTPVLVQAAACWRAARSSGFEAGPCAAGEVGVMRARGVGVPVSQTKNPLWVAVVAAPTTAWVSLAGWLKLRASLGLAVPVARPRFRLEGVPETVHQPEDVTFRFAAALEGHF